MNQRYDLFAISLLLFTVVFAAWLAMLPAGTNWIPLIGGLVAAVGIIVGAWNVGRQMQLAARGREQDRLERELPGLRKTFELANRFMESTRSKPDAGKILEEFRFLGALTVLAADFDAEVEKIIPSSPYLVRTELSRVLRQLRDAAQRFETADTKYRSASYDYGYTLPAMRSGWEKGKVAAKDEHDKAQEDLDLRIGEFHDVCEKLGAQIAADEKRREILRREQSKILGA